MIDETSPIPVNIAFLSPEDRLRQYDRQANERFIKAQNDIRQANVLFVEAQRRTEEQQRRDYIQPEERREEEPRKVEAKHSACLAAQQKRQEERQKADMETIPAVEHEITKLNDSLAGQSKLFENITNFHAKTAQKQTASRHKVEKTEAEKDELYRLLKDIIEKAETEPRKRLNPLETQKKEMKNEGHQLPDESFKKKQLPKEKKMKGIGAIICSIASFFRK